MFVAQCFARKIFIIAPPFSQPLAPAGSIPQPCTNAIAFDASTGMMAAASGAVFGKLSISIYKPPFGSASVPAAVFTPAALRHPRQLAWDGRGNLWVTDDLARKVYEFRPPFSTSSKPAREITLAVQPIGLAFDRARGLMFVGDAGGSRSCLRPCGIYVVRAPYTGAAAAILALGKAVPTALAVDNRGRLFAGIGYGKHSGSIQVFAAPFVTGRKATLSLNAPDGVMALAFDPAQNLYAQLFSTGAVVRFNGPVTRSMKTPSAQLGCPSGAVCQRKNWAGLGFGP